jgi:HSP20 family protein
MQPIHWNERTHRPAPQALAWPFAEMDQVFQQLFAPQATSKLVLPVDVVEREDAFELRMELPGVDPAEVEITLHEGVLTIQGEKREPVLAEKELARLRERPHGKFRRQFRFSVSLDDSAVQAEHRHGVLTVTLRKQQSAQPRKIEIRTA